MKKYDCGFFNGVLLFANENKDGKYIKIKECDGCKHLIEKTGDARPICFYCERADRKDYFEAGQQ